tara:strand:- start:531 stop:1529 length:999 start_codon:yes stop_codon:yes gene_type:complete
MNNSKIWIIPNRGVGDLFNLNGAIRYLSGIYEEVYVNYDPNQNGGVKEWFPDIKNLKLIPVSWSQAKLDFKDSELFNVDGFDIYLLTPFNHVEKPIANPYNLKNNLQINNLALQDIPLCYYDSLKIEEHIFWDYFKIPDLPLSDELHKLASSFGKYVFIHNSCGMFGGNKFLNLPQIQEHFNCSKEDVIFIDPENNYYPPGHKYYDVAEKLIGHSLISYKKTMEEADKIVVLDSCFMCLGLNLEIKTDECYYVSRIKSGGLLGLLQHDYTYIHETYTKNIPNFKNKRNIKEFKKFPGHKIQGVTCPCCGQPTYQESPISVDAVLKHNEKFKK